MCSIPLKAGQLRIRVCFTGLAVVLESVRPN